MSFSTHGIFWAGFKRLLGSALPQAELLVVLSLGRILLPALLVAFGSWGITLQHLPICSSLQRLSGRAGAASWVCWVVIEGPSELVLQ